MSKGVVKSERKWNSQFQKYGKRKRTDRENEKTAKGNEARVITGNYGESASSLETVEDACVLINGSAITRNSKQNWDGRNATRNE